MDRSFCYAEFYVRECKNPKACTILLRQKDGMLRWPTPISEMSEAEAALSKGIFRKYTIKTLYPKSQNSLGEGPLNKVLVGQKWASTLKGVMRSNWDGTLVIIQIIDTTSNSFQRIQMLTKFLALLQARPHRRRFASTTKISLSQKLKEERVWPYSGGEGPYLFVIVPKRKS